MSTPDPRGPASEVLQRTELKASIDVQGNARVGLTVEAEAAMVAADRY